MLSLRLSELSSGFWTVGGITAVLSVLILMHFFSVRAQGVNAQREKRLEEVEKKLRNLYGPLHILRISGERSFMEFKSRYFPNRERLFWDGIEPTEEEYKSWRIWVENVLLPNNLEIERCILENSELVDEDQIPEPMKDFLVHSAAVKALVARWNAGLYDEYHSASSFPVEFNSYIERAYHRLRKRRQQLIRKLV